MITDYYTGVDRSNISEQDLEIFSGLVIRDVRSKSSNSSDQSLTQEEKKLLMNNKDLWLFCLSSSRKSVEFQLSQHKITMNQKRSKIRSSTSETFIKETLSYIEQREIWKINAVKFLSQIESQQLYVKMLIENDK